MRAFAALTLYFLAVVNSYRMEIKSEEAGGDADNADAAAADAGEKQKMLP